MQSFQFSFTFTIEYDMLMIDALLLETACLLITAIMFFITICHKIVLL